MVCKISRHYEQKHQCEREVAIALAFNKGSPTRKKHLEKLRLLGNFHHNVTVLETGKGELILKRRPSSAEKCIPGDYLPCSHCLGFFKRQELWKHMRSCGPDDAPKCQKVQAKAKLLLFNSIAVSSSDNNSILSQVFSTMRSDEVSLLVKNDWLIKEVGLFWLKSMVKSNSTLFLKKWGNLLGFWQNYVRQILVQMPSSVISSNQKISMLWSALLKTFQSFSFKKVSRELLHHRLLKLVIH